MQVIDMWLILGKKNAGIVPAQVGVIQNQRNALGDVSAVLEMYLTIFSRDHP